MDNLPETPIQWASPGIVARRLGISRQTLVRLFDRLILPEHLGSKEDSGSYGRWKIRCDAPALKVIHTYLEDWHIWNRKPQAARSQARQGSLSKLTLAILKGFPEFPIDTPEEFIAHVENSKPFEKTFELAAQLVDKSNRSNLAEFHVSAAWSALHLERMRTRRQKRGGSLSRDNEVSSEGNFSPKPTVQDLATRLETSVASLYRKPLRAAVIRRGVAELSSPSQHERNEESEEDEGWGQTSTAEAVELSLISSDGHSHWEAQARQAGCAIRREDLRTHKDRQVERSKRNREVEALLKCRSLRWCIARDGAIILESYNPRAEELARTVQRKKSGKILRDTPKMLYVRNVEWEGVRFKRPLGFITWQESGFTWERIIEEGPTRWQGRCRSLKRAKASLVASLPKLRDTVTIENPEFGEMDC